MVGAAAISFRRYIVYLLSGTHSVYRVHEFMITGAVADRGRTCLFSLTLSFFLQLLLPSCSASRQWKRVWNLMILSLSLLSAIGQSERSCNAVGYISSRGTYCLTTVVCPATSPSFPIIRFFSDSLRHQRVASRRHYVYLSSSCTDRILAAQTQACLPLHLRGGVDADASRGSALCGF
jgi:hypothetical protein